MFAPKQLVAMVALLSVANAACVHRGSGSDAPSATPSIETPTSSPTPYSSSVPTTTSVFSMASSAAGALTSTLSSSVAVASSLAQNVASPSTSVAAFSTQTSSVAAPSSTGAAASSSSSSDGTKYMIVFGDSYSSNGFYPQGTLPSADAPMGDGSSTTSGGLNWVGYVTEQYNTSLVLTYDWAYYGADVSNAIINTGVTTDVIAQVAEFEDALVPAPSTAPWTAENTLFAVWIGVNDIGECFWEQTEYTTCPIDDVMTQYFSLLQQLYDDGARQFVLNTVPPFYKAPTFDAYTDEDLAGLLSNLDAYNAALESGMTSFKANNSDITLGQVFNTTSYFWDVLDDPTSYGLDSDITCANADGTTCVWYDGYHPGQAIHKLVAQGFVEALTGSFF